MNFTQPTPQTQDHRPQDALLGSITSYASPQAQKSKKAGKTKPQQKTVEERIESASYRLALQHHAQKLNPAGRIKICGKYQAPTAEHVTIKASTGRAYFSGLMVCGSVWECPVCMQRINAGRAQKLERAINRTASAGLSSYLLTLTISHKKTDRLADLLKAMSKAYRYLWSGKDGQALKARLGWQGSAKALEVRHGTKNGWHPHQHIIVLTDHEHEESALELLTADIKKRWVQAVKHVGYTATPENGADFKRSKAKLFDYLTKSGQLALELTSADTKKAPDSFSPLELLDRTYNGNEQAGYLWGEYTHSIKGYKQLVLCAQFKAHSHEDEETPEDDENPEILEADSGATESESTSSVIIATINRAIWYQIRTYPTDLRGDILALATLSGGEAVARYLQQRLNLSTKETLSIIPPPRD